jgi:hypothetical protein
VEAQQFPRGSLRLASLCLEAIVHERDGDSHRDFWGILWQKNGAFDQPVEFTLASADGRDVLEYAFPLNKLERCAGFARTLAEQGLPRLPPRLAVDYG